MFFRTAQCSLFVLAILPAQVTVTPNGAKLAPGASKDFDASVASNWFVNGVSGGNSTVGQVNATGRYTAPATVPASNAVTLKAVSKSNSKLSGSVTITLVQATPVIRSVSPRNPAAGKEVTLTLTAANFLATARVRVNDMVWPAVANPSAGTLTAKGTFPAAGTYAITILNPDPGAALSAPVSYPVTAPASPPVTVTVTPGAATVALGTTQQFTASVPVAWSVTAGTISAGGLYTAPAAMPASSTVTVRATSTADSTKFATAAVTLQEPASLTVTPGTATVALGTTQQFTASVPVTWAATAGTISAGGLYTAPAAMPASSAVTVRATSTADSTKFATATVTLQAAEQPQPNPGLLSAARLLDQAAFGPTPQALDDVQARGVTGWIDDQFNQPESALSLTGDLRAQMLNRLAHAPDQLRQRVVWALSQIIVVSMDKNPYAEEYIPYLQILSRNAFGNYRTLLREVTLSPQMGKYLDLANSNKPGVGGGANENFPRELLQLFTIGLVELNLDGTPKPGSPPTYSQDTVRQFALALTGWTYPTAAGSTPGSNNWENFSKPAMESRPANHDMTAKTLLNGVVLPASQSPEQDLDGVIDCVFNHPNAGPFLATRLIRFLVTSNPSPEYVTRVAQVFNSNASGERGDLKAVIRAILTDPEARNDQATPNQGRLKEPVRAYVNFVRTLNGRISATNQITWTFSRMGQALTASPSVFGYYSPLYRLPGNPQLFGPEFQIYTPTESILLGNEIFQVLNNPAGDPSIDLSPFQAVASDAQKLVDLVCTKLHHGRTPAGLRAAILKAVQAAYDNKQRVDIAVYLAALSGEFAVQY